MTHARDCLPRTASRTCQHCLVGLQGLSIGEALLLLRSLGGLALEGRSLYGSVEGDCRPARVQPVHAGRWRRVPHASQRTSLCRPCAWRRYASGTRPRASPIRLIREAIGTALGTEAAHIGPAAHSPLLLSVHSHLTLGAAPSALRATWGRRRNHGVRRRRVLGVCPLRAVPRDARGVHHLLRPAAVPQSLGPAREEARCVDGP